MPQYVMVYLGGNAPSSPEEGRQHMAKYMDSLASLGDSAVSSAQAHQFGYRSTTMSELL